MTDKEKLAWVKAQLYILGDIISESNGETVEETDIDNKEDYAKARKEFIKAWEIACKYCEKERGLPTYNCEYCPLVNTAENFREYLLKD